MIRLITNIGAVAVAGLLVASCGGGTSEPLPAEGEVSSAVDATATDAAAVADEAVAQATDAAADVMENAGWQDMQANWQDSIGNIKDRWAELTEEDLLTVNGDRDQLVSLVQDKYGLDRETAEMEVNDWASSL